jgi:hypothetical protein
MSIFGTRLATVERQTCTTQLHTRNIMAPSSAAGIAIFDAPLAKELVQQRFPTGYLGVRRLRPSSRAVARVLVTGGGKSSTMPHGVLPSNSTAAGTTTPASSSPPPVFKIKDPDTGQERRMTTQEKKTFKRELYAKRKRLEQEAGEPRQHPASSSLENEEHTAVTTAAATHDKDNVNYLQWTIDATKIAEEIADLRGEREGVPPVYIPSPLAALALSTVILIGGTTDTPTKKLLRVVLDDEWAQNWAIDLKKSMKQAEDNRDQEEMRPMPYHLVPEVWQRMRPSTLGTGQQQADHHNKNTDRSSPTVFQNGTSWSFCELRPSSLPNDDVAVAIIQLLHAGTSLHIACGAKFGCDYLLYDGLRSERHAFAGVRFGLFPNAYEMSGYVRCLNTAGKLALLAAAQQDTTEAGEVFYRVAIVDLALVKIVETTFKKPKKTMEQRLQNLSKATT